jgi:hypothetical protein
MPAEKYTDFNLPTNAYAAFDAVSLKQLIIERLKSSDVFTDYAFEGSNLSSIIDILAYSYHVSLFYLNTKSSEADFNQVELYENMNKLVSFIDYKPLGAQTSICPFEAVAQQGLTEGNYIIPRFSYVATNGIFFSIPKDIYFEKTVAGEEVLESIGNNNLLYQGQFKEHDIITAIGQDFETLTIVNENPVSETQDTFIDTNNIFVYVHSTTTGKWHEWTAVQSLYNSSPLDYHFERRLNPYGRYEIKFGNSIYGRKLTTGDTVAIYYLMSDGARGSISTSVISGRPFTRFNSQQFRAITADIYSDTQTVASATDLNNIQVTNTSQSTDYKTMETVSEIRTNAPSIFQSQNRVVTINDFDSFVSRNFSNILISSKAVSNSTYIDEYIKYFYDIGLSRPNDNVKVLLNQVAFADSCDFNNIYIFGVPRALLTSTSQPQSLPLSLKTLMVNQLNAIKMQNVEIVPSDPVYSAFDLGVVGIDESPSIDIIDQCMFQITRSNASSISKSQIKSQVYSAIVDFFAPANQVLGQLIDIGKLTQTILSISGVAAIQTIRKNGDTITSVPALSFVVWNPEYPEDDIVVTQHNIKLPYFKFPYLNNSNTLNSKIIVV